MFQNIADFAILTRSVKGVWFLVQKVYQWTWKGLQRFLDAFLFQDVQDPLFDVRSFIRRYHENCGWCWGYSACRLWMKASFNSSLHGIFLVFHQQTDLTNTKTGNLYLLCFSFVSRHKVIKSMKRCQNHCSIWIPSQTWQALSMDLWWTSEKSR